MIPFSPRRLRNGLDHHCSDILCAADGDQLLGVPVIFGIRHLDEVQREEHRVKVEAAQRLQVDLRRVDSVTGDPDIFEQALPARLLKGFQCAAFHRNGIQLLHFCDSMKLVQIQLVCLKPLERLAKLVPGPLLGSLLSLASQEEALAFPLHPRADPILGVAVGWGNVDVVDPCLDDHFHDPVGILL